MGNVCNSMLVVIGYEADVTRFREAVPEEGAELPMGDAVVPQEEPGDGRGDAAARAWGSAWAEVGLELRTDSPTVYAVFLSSGYTPPDRWVVHRALRGAPLEYDLFYVEPEASYVGKLAVRYNTPDRLFGAPLSSLPWLLAQRDPDPDTMDWDAWVRRNTLLGFEHEFVMGSDNPNADAFITRLNDNGLHTWEHDVWETLDGKQQPEDWQGPSPTAEEQAARHALVSKLHEFSKLVKDRPEA